MKKLAIFTSLLVAAIAPKAQAQQCSNFDLYGAYSFVVSGTVTVSGASVPFAAAGQTLYDGQGGAQGVIQATSNGTILPVAGWTATYSVTSVATPGGQPVCVLTKTISVPSYNLTVSFFGTAGAGFTELRFIATSSGTTLSGTAKKQ
jgi:hypothetical protein